MNNRYKIMLARGEWTANCQWEVHRHDLLHVSSSDFPIDRIHTGIVNSYKNLLVCK